jgi:hypothetical protein
MQNPIGLHENRATWDDAVSGFAKTMLARDPTLTEDIIESFGRNMFGGDFVFSVSRDFVSACRTPRLLQPGADTPHCGRDQRGDRPSRARSRHSKGLARPHAPTESIRRVTDFLTRHTPTA